MRPVVMLFAKAPIPESVKTRLIPGIGAELAAALHRAFVSDTLRVLQTLTPECDIELHTDVPTDAWPECASRKLQCPGDLGRKMLAALEGALCEGRPIAMIAGSDSPTLPAEYLAEMLDSPADVCLGPCTDGGYYAIACRRTHPAMFRDVTWSSAQTRSETVAAIERAGLSVALGREWYDVDCAEDLDRLLADPRLGEATRAVASRCVGARTGAPSSGPT